ncbi:SDR family NAD(P)-dependent oxidoreductase [Rhodococcus sp. NPDC056960]|uniref:SDR family NAD(P)-dependent oxidoreductase n=1 Tax=unclassified Rhodococcus (in: high G+C Gram-positive bacteria) TaxID=192944 RepID=UPI00163A84BD|nr:MULTISPECIES: SDR family oxidoreductase [unclassified Rhodococcus (in: high G+C Gram-positive bacteria)]MBC2639499.1 SDR family oxidoreductase [Rhodococcus sp. 3A]MBC2895756.1 SDR family oxidoreductase [Rhodococcus sp. 4CII]
MKLQDKVAVITGGGSGLGRQGAQLFASEGAKVAVVDIDGDRAEQTVKLVEQQGGTAIAVTADVSDEAAVYRSVETTVEQFGKLDIMWANAGVVSRGGVPSVAGGEHVEFQDLTDADWQHVLGVNLSGVVYSCKAAVPAMRANGGGVILATSSAASFAAYHSIAMYSATKAGVNGLVRGLSLDLGRYGIRVNALAPTHGMSPNFLMGPGTPVIGQSYEETAGPWDPGVSPIPLKLQRPPSLVDNAKVALFLASDDSAYISGLTLPATDGGTLSRVAMMFEEDAPNPTVPVD